jgi:ABC-type dipeptide/oligopeptide/nickel transport system permease subunit
MTTAETFAEDAALVVEHADAVAPSRARLLRRFLTNKLAVAGAFFLALVVAVAMLAPLVAPHDPDTQDLLLRLQRPGTDGHPLGTDQFGRDVLSRLIYGARVSLVAAAEAVGVAALIGIPLGMLAGYGSRRADAVLNWSNDALMSVPALILALTIVAVLGPGSLTNAMLAIGIVTAPRFFRVARAATQDVRHETYIEASRAIGCKRSRNLGRHVFPNAVTPLVIQVTLALGAAVVAEASLSFLGFGVRPPTASWGSMLNDAYVNLSQAPYLVYIPGLTIAAVVLAFTLVGDGLRDALGTRTKAGADV